MGGQGLVVLLSLGLGALLAGLAAWLLRRGAPPGVQGEEAVRASVAAREEARKAAAGEQDARAETAHARAEAGLREAADAEFDAEVDRVADGLRRPPAGG